MFKGLKILTALLISISFAACGGDDSQSDSSSFSGTGFLKIDFPSIDINSTSALDTEGNLDYRGIDPALIMLSTISNDNTESSCQGVPDSIPFLVCLVESYGINSVGTYTGNTPGGQAATAVVSNISGDPNGFVLEAVVSLKSNSEQVFKYKATTAGDKGVIEAHPQKIFGAEIAPFAYGLRLEWDSTLAPATLQISYDGTQTGDLAFTDLYYLSAVIDETEGVSDLSYKEYTGSSSSLNSSFTQLRFNSSRILSLTAQCSNSSSPILGTDCFSISEAALFDVNTDGNQLECFNAAVLADGSIPLSVADSIALTDATIGSLDGSGSYTDPSCEALSTVNTNGSSFAIRLDKDDAPGNTLNGINHNTRARSFSDMQLLSNGSFLTGN